MLGLLQSSKQKEAKHSYRRAVRLLSGAPGSPSQGVVTGQMGQGYVEEGPQACGCGCTRWEGVCGRALIVVNSIPGYLPRNSRLHRLQRETHGLAEGLSDPASNCLVTPYQPHISGGLTKQPLNKGGCEWGHGCIIPQKPDPGLRSIVLLLLLL